MSNEEEKSIRKKREAQRSDNQWNVISSYIGINDYSIAVKYKNSPYLLFDTQKISAKCVSFKINNLIIYLK